MISRRLIRIKVLQVLYSYFQSDESSFSKFEQQLFFSIHKSYDLYHYLMLLIIEISDFAKIRIEHARQKNIQNSEDINPNTKFIDNRLIHQLSINSQLNHFVQNQKLTWSKNPDLIKNLYYELKEFEPYKEYMANESKSYIADKKIVSEIFSKFFLFSESLDTTLEEESIYWNDDIEYIVSMILKTIKQFRADDKAYTELLPLFRDEEDEEFAKKLGQTDVKALTEIIRKNLENEAKQKTNQQFEIDILDAMIEKTKFDTIPEVLINSERQKMFYELKRDLEKNGVSVEQYMKDIKKTEDELFEDFRAQALKRAQAALISRQVALEKKLVVSEEEIDTEIDTMKQAYAQNKEAQENLTKPEVRDSIATVLQNKKVVQYLVEQVEGKTTK